MKGNIFKIIISLGMSIAMFASASALSADVPSVAYDYYNNKVTISGDIQGKHTVLRILHKGNTLEELKVEPYDDSIVFYRNQADLSDSDKYSFTIRYAELDDENFASGKYIAYLTSDVLEEPQDFELALFTRSQYQAVVELLKGYADNDNDDLFKATLEEKELELGYVSKLYECIDKTSELVPFKNYIKNNQFGLETNADNTRVINTFLAMQMIAEGKLTNIDDYLDDILVTSSELYKNYVKYTSDAAGNPNETKQKYLTGKLATELSGNFDYHNFENSMKKAIILTAIRYADGFGDVKTVLGIYGSNIGITDIASSSVYKAMSGQDYSNVATLKSAYDTFKLGTQNPQPDFSKPSGGMSYEISSPEKDAKDDEVKVYFNDINGVEWASVAILSLADKGIVSGTGDGNFKPNLNVTREEFAKILIGAMNLADAQYNGNVFSDVNENDWFCPYVNIAYKNNILKGMGNGNFGTGQLITRQDMVVMICNAIEFRGVQLHDGKLIFADANMISDYARKAVAALYEIGAVNGISETEFDPLGQATRAQAAKIIYGVLEMLQ